MISADYHSDAVWKTRMAFQRHENQATVLVNLVAHLHTSEDDPITHQL